MISRDQLREMFEGLARKTKWDLSGPLLWGYFFTSSNRQPLEDASLALARRGYRIVEIREGENGVWWLHVEKEEHHSVESLDIRNQELEAFADEWSLSSYDGMDVGPGK